MKANELTDGIYVYFNCFDGSKIIVKVTGFKDGVVYGVSKTSSHWCTIEKVEPIPLTPEILEKNGFVLEEYKYVLKYDHYVEVWVIFATSNERHSVIHNSVIHIDDDRERIPTTYHNTIKYVNELQHAFKLCKIDKKIEL